MGQWTCTQVTVYTIQYSRQCSVQYKHDSGQLTECTFYINHMTLDKLLIVQYTDLPIAVQGLVELDAVLPGKDPVPEQDDWL